MPIKTQYITSTDGAKIAYKVFGKGFPLVLVHGMGSTKEMWVDRKWVELFQNEFTVIAIDIRGHGESEKSYHAAFYSINKIRNDIFLIAKACGFDSFYYFGHSYGATIGLQLCKEDTPIKKAICAGTTFGSTFFKETVPMWLNEYENFEKSKRSNALEKLDLSKEDIEWIKENDLELIITQLKAWHTWTGVDIKDIKTKLAVYSGTKDNPQVLENFSLNKHELNQNNISMKIFDNLSHSDLVSKIELVAPWVLDFLKN